MNSKPRAGAHYTGPERRHYPRHTVQIPIDLQVEASDTVLVTETTDLSRNSCYVRLENPLPVGLRVQGVLWLDTVPIQVTGRIVTRHPEFGNGIMFLNMLEPDAEALKRYLEAVVAEA